ncbi:hypothetical protein B0H16DRAFT_1564909 [Mycena metata]|uniref:Secreted protein n=1 Tax=Mycena metata TaxID=1033252 RepID=A0AAD7IFY7_9AGAR|nr:hypothetical protein B0H16DRAFT_1564909 [Mycena metata]
MGGCGMLLVVWPWLLLELNPQQVACPWPIHCILNPMRCPYIPFHSTSVAIQRSFLPTSPTNGYPDSSPSGYMHAPSLGRKQSSHVQPTAVGNDVQYDQVNLTLAILPW